MRHISEVFRGTNFLLRFQACSISAFHREPPVTGIGASVLTATSMIPQLVRLIREINAGRIIYYVLRSDCGRIALGRLPDTKK